MSPEIHTYESVWDAVADGAGEAANLKLRSQLMDALEAYIGRENITQEEASRRFGVPRSRVSELVNGRISKFSIDKLVNMAARVGLTIRIIVGQDARPSVEAAASTVSADDGAKGSLDEGIHGAGLRDRVAGVLAGSQKTHEHF